MGRLIRGIVGLCAVIGFCTSTSQAVLIKDMGLVLDTTTGIRWVPVTLHSLTGALAIEDLPPGQRYATDDEVSTLLQTYIFPLACEFNGSPFGCSPSAFKPSLTLSIFFGLKEIYCLISSGGSFPHKVRRRLV